MDIDLVGTHIVEASVDLHRKIGPGLLEEVYGKLLPEALKRRGLYVERQVIVPFEFEGHRFERGMRLDLLVEQQVVVELKSQEKLTPFHFKEVLTYLRLLDL